MHYFPEQHDMFLRVLLRHNVQFLVVGGVAVKIHGVRDRPTGDLDIWVGHAERDRNGLSAALYAVGFQWDKIDQAVRQLSAPNGIAKLNHPILIDLLAKMDGENFDYSYERRKTHQWGNLEVPIVPLEVLVSAKTTSGRDKDLADVQAIHALRQD